MAFQAEFKEIGGQKFYTNALVFATEKEAEAYARDLFSRWMGVDEWRVVEVDKPVTYIFDFEQHNYYPIGED
jgi:hypothetical protein